jgi:rhodanese-related sulfurtransferase
MRSTIDARSLASERDRSKILDVRTPAEFATARIPEAVNIPLDQLDDHAEAIADEVDDTLVLVCGSGQRAAQAQRILAEAGLRDVVVLDGGMQAWQDHVGDVHVEDPRWGLERQVRLVAGAIVLVSVLASFLWPPARVVAGLVGAGLVFAAVSNTCAMGALLSRLPYNQGPGADPVAARRHLAEA